MDEKRLFLLDAYALIYRAYYALMRNPRITSAGFNTSAIFGFCNTLDEILRKENPSHIAVCFDPSGPTFRHEEYAEYKAGRDKQPEDITAAVPYIKDIIRAWNIPVIEKSGFEADDVIGTLSRMAEKDGYVTYMMTPDKDYGQLVTEKVLMYRPSLRGEGFEIRGPKEVCERYSIDSPSQVIDLLALEGDTSDNIPGCPGVGEKTAAKLIREWGSVENLLDHTGDLKGALKTKIENNAEQIRFSKYLATIRTDVPLEGIEIDDLKRRPADFDRLISIYKELEFRTFVKRLAGSATSTETQVEEHKADEGKTGPETQAFPESLFDIPEETLFQGSPKETAVTLKADYTLLETPEEIAELINKVTSQKIAGIYFDTVGEEAMTARWRGLAIATEPMKAYYIYIPADKNKAQEITAILEPLLGDSRGDTLLVTQDLKRDYIIGLREKIMISGKLFDTSLAHYLLEPEMKHSPEYLAARYLHYELSENAVMLGLPKKQPLLDGEKAMASSCELADIALRLHDCFVPLLEEGGLTRLYEDIELPLATVLGDMEYTGVRIDVRELHNLSLTYTARLREMEQAAYELAGGPFNVGSPMQVGEVLFERMKIDPKAKRTKRGAYSTTEEILEKYKNDYPIVDLILKIRGLKKLLATYIDALPAMVNPATGKIHTSFNQTGTATGRISSANPNLQNIPVRSDDGREIRRAFVADPGCLIMSADYSQIELRLIADFSRDPDMVDAFLKGDDIHRRTAAKIYHEKLEEVTDNQRRNAKTANFGILYGISAFGLSERLGIPRSEAKELIEGYFASYPSIKEYIDKAVEAARRDGYVSTIKGRRRLLPDINSRNSVVRSFAERNAVNAPLQGSAADIIKIAMVDIQRIIRAEGLRSRMIMQVHDELIFNVVPEELEHLRDIVVTHMRDAYKGLVPLEVSVGVGADWVEAAH